MRTSTVQSVFNALKPTRQQPTSARRLHLAARQHGQSISAEVTVRAGISVNGVWLRLKDNWIALDTVISPVDTTDQSDGEPKTFRLEIDLASIQQRLSDSVHDSSPTESQVLQGSNQESLVSLDEQALVSKTWSEAISDGSYSDRCTLYLGVTTAGTDIMGGAVFEDGRPEDVDQLKAVSYRVTFGRFQNTSLGEFHQIRSGECLVTPYVNRRGVLSLRLNEWLENYQRVVISKLRMRDGVLNLEGDLRVRHSRILNARLLLTARGLDNRWTAPLQIQRDYSWEETHYGHARYEFRVFLNFGGLKTDLLPDDVILDAWVQSDMAFSPELSHTSRIGRTPLIQRQLSNLGGVRGHEKSTLIIPYYTMKAKRTSFRLEKFPTASYDQLRNVMRQPIRNLLGNRSNRPIWIVGEQPERAQDTGLAFFQYVRANHPDIDAFYVIDPRAAEAQNLAGLDHVLEYRSPEHIRLSLLAERFIGSHHPSYLYPTRADSFKRLLRARNVFLQHGVIAMKWMEQTYGKKAASFNTDLFIVSSEREKEFIVNDLGYAPKEVAVTGLSRFDQLFDKTQEVKHRQIFIMPTWRDWLHTGDQFLASTYYNAWHALLTDPRFADIVAEHNLNIVFCLHPNMQAYADHFAAAPVKILVQGEADVQKLIKQSSLLITDYSSVAWDFSFLHKPVLFYQFDRSRMFRRVQPHLNLDDELPGPIAANVELLLQELSDQANAGISMPEKFKNRADKFIKYRDRSNSARIFHAISLLSQPYLPARSGQVKELRTAGFNFFRKSRYYHPLMRTVYRVLSKLPADENIVFFESGLGRQVNDSPRAIYDELVARGDNRRKVWSVRGRASFGDENTTVVKRNSPSYFWFLARSKYWVSNQNLPHYITRGPGRFYVQTWHGTPLKRMALDIEEIHGRDEGYLGRVTKAAAQWSVLVSPSQYATSCLRSAYGYRGPSVEFGYPRNDALVSQNRDSVGSDVRERLGIPPHAKTVLYAPTFRDDVSLGNGRFGFELPFSLENFCDQLGDDVVLILRTHSLVAGRLHIPEHLRDAIVDASKFPDIQPLFLAADVLVTDYSSVYFDYSLLRRPMIFYAYDLERYRDSLRGFYLDYEATVPGPVETTEQGLFASIQEGLAQPDRSESTIENFVEKFNPHSDGGATARTVDLMLESGSKISQSTAIGKILRTLCGSYT